MLLTKPHPSLAAAAAAAAASTPSPKHGLNANHVLALAPTASRRSASLRVSAASVAAAPQPTPAASPAAAALSRVDVLSEALPFIQRFLVQVRRRGDEVAGAAGVGDPRPGPAVLRRPPSGPRPRRRARDQLLAGARRRGAPVPQRAPRHGRGHHGGRGDGARGQGQQAARLPHQPRGGHRRGAVRQGRVPPHRAALPRRRLPRLRRRGGARRPRRPPPHHRVRAHPGHRHRGGRRGRPGLQHQHADTAAGEIAAAVGAEKLLLLTDVSGILADRDDPGSLVREVDVAGVRRMVAEGKVGGGMIPKVECCVRAISQGVRTASIIDGRVPHSLLLEILTDEGTGTMITG